ncbi:MAG TPA: NAD(P)H-dependent glycerol-3-phosphate dehydrogenase [Verrucomicrobiae bacterium]|jgi:glycerol-3-phosphate dehydrogenase (NAD(P)+)|nr:NAD(P)H-dependent glycerol-3-phosphate dehydrogenase [Verrucomicrobiae bacterium]
MKVTVIGAGGWGTALANLLRKSGHEIVLWGRNAEHLEQIAASGRNEAYLPGIATAQGVRCQADLPAAVAGADCVVIAVPSKFFREVTSRLATYKGLAVSVTKGIEYESGLTMSGILQTTMPHALAAVLSGPSLALEVAREIPAAVVAAHRDAEVARQTQILFHRPAFRVYTSQDVLGVELGGAVKNVVAIAAGIGDGLGFGDNSKAGLITRGVAEMRRLGVARGASAETFSGLSGLGDLVVTCYSRLSRNRAFGERVGKGERVETILASTRSVAEGHPTAKAAWQLARTLGIETPIIDEVYDMLYRGKEVGKAVQDLMARDMKQED